MMPLVEYDMDDEIPQREGEQWEPIDDFDEDS